MTPWGNPLPDTADIAETVWTGVTALGTLAAAVGAGMTATNLKAARRAARRARAAAPAIPLHLAITGQAVRNELLTVATLTLLLVVLALFVVIGAAAMLTPEPVRRELRAEDLIATVALVIGAVLVTVATVLLTIGSILNRRDRHRLVNQITGQYLREQLARRAAERAQGDTDAS